MENDLEKFINENALTVDNVRRLVDDYSLISHYIGEELEFNTTYSSPLREGDNTPSFSIFKGYGAKGNQDRVYFKDQAGYGSGNVYKFLQLYLKSPTIKDVLRQVNFDLQLGLDGQEVCVGLKPTVIKTEPLQRERPTIRIVSQITSKYTNYWQKKYEITEDILNMYFVKCVHSIHYKYKEKTDISTPSTLCIAYAIGEYYKLYCPFEKKEFKFRNNYPATYVEGHLQLDWSRDDLLVITKSMKDCMLFRQHWNIQAVSGKSETTMIPDFIMQKYLKHFKRIVLWLDPDATGCASTEKYISLYPSLEVANVPSWVEQKDPTDMFEAMRLEKTTSLVKQILKL